MESFLVTLATGVFEAAIERRRRRRFPNSSPPARGRWKCRIWAREEKAAGVRCERTCPTRPTTGGYSSLVDVLFRIFVFISSLYCFIPYFISSHKLRIDDLLTRFASVSIVFLVVFSLNKSDKVKNLPNISILLEREPTPFQERVNDATERFSSSK